jgi:PcfJ-like protein
MARKPVRGEEQFVLTGPMHKHLAALGHRSVTAYLSWCTAHSFVASLKKSHTERDAELAVIVRQQVLIENQARLHRNPRKLIAAMCQGEVTAADITRPQLQQLCRSVERSTTKPEARASLQAFLLWAEAETDILFETFNTSYRLGDISFPVVDALIKLHDRRGQWVRKPEDWKRPSHNARRQFASLIRHLVARFPVPEFMDAAWLRTGAGSRQLREWYLHIASGKNIRTAKTPMPLTSKMAHHFLLAPDTVSIEGAFRWGEVHALGGDATLTNALLGTRLGNSFDNHEFWSSVIRFFVANPMLDRQHVGPIIDFLQAQKFQSREIVDQTGRTTIEPPPQPNLQMRGRTADTLLAHVERWHTVLGRAKGAENLFFKASGFKELSIKSGSKDAPNIWSFRELHSGSELIAEGKAMRHCVASYARSCAAGSCSIWAMDVERRTGREKIQTIEVSKQGVIVQCRGHLNRLPTASEFDIVRRWAEAAGLTISPYVRVAT